MVTETDKVYALISYGIDMFEQVFCADSDEELTELAKEAFDSLRYLTKRLYVECYWDLRSLAYILEHDFDGKYVIGAYDVEKELRNRKFSVGHKLHDDGSLELAAISEPLDENSDN